MNRLHGRKSSVFFWECRGDVPLPSLLKVQNVTIEASASSRYPIYRTRLQSTSFWLGNLQLDETNLLPTHGMQVKIIFLIKSRLVTIYINLQLLHQKVETKAVFFFILDIIFFIITWNLFTNTLQRCCSNQCKIISFKIQGVHFRPCKPWLHYYIYQE